MKRYENVDDALCREMEKLDKKYGAGDVEMSLQDLEMIRLLYSSMVKAETYQAMLEESGEYDEDEMSGRGYSGRGRSYARRRDSMGRYMRSGDYGYSGHYPMYPYYPGRY